MRPVQIYNPSPWLILLWLISTGVLGTTSEARLIETRDLKSDAELARRDNSPIVLLVSQDHCPFCSQIKEEILVPMIKAGDYRGQILIREIFIDPGVEVVDFKGRKIVARDFVLGYGVDLTPTLLFLAPDGREISERIVGIQTPELFFFYVDKAIQQAITALVPDRGEI